MMGLPDGRKSFKIGLIPACDIQPAGQTDSFRQQRQLALTHGVARVTRSSADADKPARRFIGQSMSPNIVPFHILRLVTLSLKGAVFTIFDFKSCRNLEIGVRGHSRSSKVVSFDRPCMVSY